MKNNGRRDFFKPNDVVNFELSSDGTTPRWWKNKDTGSSGVKIDGVVHRKTQDFIEVASIFPNGKLIYNKFPNYHHEDYDLQQWWRPGFLSKYKKEDFIVNCECGNGNDSGLHYLFCPRHFKNLGVYDEELEMKFETFKWDVAAKINEKILEVSLN